MAAEDYSYIGNSLAKAGYLAIILQYDLPSDPIMPNTGNILQDREPFWLRGENTLEAALGELPREFPHYDWRKLTLMGHSQGGDIAALYAAAHPERLSTLITLDNRRIPLPHDSSVRILTLRSSDQQPDPGVLPANSDAACVLRLINARHNDMTDHGPFHTRQNIQTAILRFLTEHKCSL